MALSHSPQIVRDGLVLYLDAANIKSYPGSGSNILNLVGTNQGVFTNGAFYNSDNLGSFTFDGVNDYINIGGAIEQQTNGPVTIEVVFRFNTIKDVNGIFGYRIAVSDNPIHIEGRTAGLRCRIGSTDLSGMSGIDVNTIYHVVFSHTGTLLQVIKNGTQIIGTLNSLNGTIFGTSSFFSIGESSAPGNRPLLGNVYLFKIYNRALSLQEANQNFNAIRGRYGI